ncbi:MAG TPA: chitobiase/beta-hexosaminidase C-terminal domain-containing protein [Pirellulales bacterium]|jgi:hypothetical protein|nr:chitobiase/beta-hexosaminidase C-terminal domain-containing protein [Pirellulales bacterium]
MIFAIRFRARRCSLAWLLLAVAGSCAVAQTAPAAAPAARQIRPTWGSEALWGYWRFGNDYVPKRDWKIVSATSEGGAAHGSRNLIDGDSETYFLAAGQSSYEFVIDLGQTYELGAFTLLTENRPDQAVDSRPAKLEFYLSADRDARGEALVSADFAGAIGSETVFRFAAQRGRYVTLRATARDAAKSLCLSELSLVTPAVLQQSKHDQEQAAIERRTQWEQRNSPAAVAALGQEFLDLVFCTSDDINRSNLRGRPLLDEVGKLKQAGKFAEGLRAFRDYYFDKLRRPQNFGILANDVQPYGRGYAGISEFPQSAMDKDLDAPRLKQQIEQADRLLKGIATLENGQQVSIGEPGAVDWWAPAPPYGYTTASRQSYPYRELWWGTAFQPLCRAYIATKDPRYLQRWIDYLDDWSLNADFLTLMPPAINHDNSSYPAVMTLRMFAAMIESLPYGSDAIPAPAFARIMKKLVMDAPLNWIVYMRACGNGWTPGAGSLLFAILIDEFKVAPIYFRETRRRNIEDINVVQELRDGTETHQWPGYNYLLLNNIGAVRLMQARDGLGTWSQPLWEKELHTPQWQRELQDNLLRRASYAIHWAAPNGEYPLVTHHEPANEKQGKLRDYYNRFPEMLDDPTNARIYSTLYGDGSVGTPQYTSEWFPYGGYNIARDGWRPTDASGSMFCSPRPGCGSVGSGCKNNAFSLAAYGMDLLSDDLAHSYVRTTSPIQVDGRRQMLDFYVPKINWPTAHRGDLITEWTDPAPWRWHASERFNLMEGNFAGVYSNNFHDRENPIDDVGHNRQVLYARRAGLWILTDRLTAKKPHDYEQLWWLPLKHRKESAGFTPAEIVVDPNAKTIKTKRTGSDTWFSWDRLQDVTVGNVNLSMYQFTDASLKYDSKTLPNSGELYDWQRISATWHGAGDQQIVTVLFPRAPTPEHAHPDGSENDLAQIQPMPNQPDQTGFTATTAAAQKISYRAAKDQDAVLECGPLRLRGEALLVVHSAGTNESITGIVLGAKELSVLGKPVSIDTPDFEFALPASGDLAGWEQMPIYRPIDPVKILPESDVFITTQTVTLACDTRGVKITYTLDGTEPTPHSARYTGPFEIDATRTVKARAYRPHVEHNPLQTSGTQATPTSMALFQKKLASRAESVTPHAAGLKCEYREAFWKDLWLTPDKVAPAKSGSIAALFDLSLIPPENRPLGAAPGPREKCYSLTYTGYLKVPTEGVYTLHAPHEYVHCDEVAGYELQVYVGHALNPDNRTTKREENLNYWYPATRLHGFGTWSVPLQAGYHEFKVVYLDFRMDAPARLNRTAKLRDAVWSGAHPDLQISGPGLPPQPIPAAWLWH